MFKEPSWNNPVVRFIKADKSDIVPKIIHNWKTKSLSTKNLVKKMIDTLKAEKQDIPAYLTLIDEDLNGFNKAEDLKELSKSQYKHLPLGNAQAKAIDNALRNKGNPEKLLSPTQLKYFKAITKYPAKDWPLLEGEELIKAWTEFTKFYTFEIEAI